MTYRVKTLDGWRTGKGRHRDFDTLDAANDHALAASMVQDGTFYCVARMEGDNPIEEAFAVKGVLFHVKSGGVA